MGNCMLNNKTNQYMYSISYSDNNLPQIIFHLLLSNSLFRFATFYIFEKLIPFLDLMFKIHAQKAYWHHFNMYMYVKGSSWILK